MWFLKRVFMPFMMTIEDEGGGGGGDDPKFIDSVPEAYRDKPWVQENAKDPDTFYKFLDNQNALGGKKGIIMPGEGEDKSAFFNELGRPEDAAGYEFSNIEPLKESKRNGDMDTKVKELFHTNGISKEAAEKIVQGYETVLFEQNKESIAKTEADDKAFADFNTELFGDKKDAIVANAQKLIRENINPKALPALDKMDGETMSLVVAAVEGLYTKFGKEDAFKGGDGGGAGTAETMDELSAQQRELMKNPGYTDWQHPEHAGLMAKDKTIMAKMRALDK